MNDDDIRAAVAKRTQKYILDENNEPRPATLLEWGAYLESRRNIIEQTELDGVRVSTVFLGLDHSFALDGPMILFETMVFGKVLDGQQDRYATYAAAKAGHAVMVKLVERALSKAKSKLKLVKS